MTRPSEHDRIDRELTKIFFGSEKEAPPPAGKHPAPKKPGKRRKKRYFLVPLSILAVAVAFSLFMLREKKVNISFKVDFFPKEQTAGSLTEPLYRPAKKVPTGPKKTRVFYDFERSNDSWEIPGWAAEKPDHVGTSLSRTDEISSSGDWSIKLDADFPGDIWSAAIVEVQQFLDLTKYEEISADIYVPETCPFGLKAKIILTVGKDWRWVEMTRTLPLIPGEWTTVKASIAEDSYDWKRTTVDTAFKEDVRKIDIRIESNRKPRYTGPIYIDNIRMSYREME